MDRFIDVVSARSAIGHDKDGNVLLMHVDGKTDARGWAIWSTEFDKDIYNLINIPISSWFRDWENLSS